ncbi:MAG: VacJ family lipoprotein [Betaproteobacteria bacterium]|nr:VacJ family lipoprotein [Betaproteobacteria bacterium]
MVMVRVLLVVALAALLFGGFAGSGGRMDALEGFDRVLFVLNDNLDKISIEPAAQINEAIFPTAIPLGVGNYCANIGEMLIAANDLLQRNGPALISDLGRMLANTPLGVFGFGDVASERGVEEHGRTSARLSAPVT